MSDRPAIFIVEDHPRMRKMLRQLIERTPDLEVAGEAASAEAALDQLPELNPDLVMVDLSLPGMSGLELVKHLSRVEPGLRCLVVTGHSDSLYQSAAIAAGARGFITKDDPDEVLGAVLDALRG